MTKDFDPIKDLEMLAAIYRKLRFGNRPPTVKQCEEADAAIERLRAHLKTTEGAKA